MTILTCCLKQIIAKMHTCAVLVSLHLTLLLYPFTSGQVSFKLEPTPSPTTGGYPSPTTDYPTTDYPTTDYPTTDYPTTDYPTTDYTTTDYTTTDYPTEETYPVYPYPSEGYPYDPYEPYDPYDPYPFQYCELNEDEYGRPYYGAYDRYVSRNSYPPRVPEGYPTAPPTSDYPTLPPSYSTSPPEYPTSAPPGYPPSYRPYRPSLPPPETYEVNLTRIARKRRQVMTLPSCIVNNECYQQAGT